MNGLTNYITEWKWYDIITTWYVLIDDEYQAVIRQSRHKTRSRGPAPLMSDSEVIMVRLIIETFFKIMKKWDMLSSVNIYGICSHICLI